MYSTPILHVIVLVTAGFAMTTFHFLEFVQSATEPDSVKVGVINMQQVIVSTRESKRALAEMEGKFAQRQKDLTILSEQIDAVRRRLEAGQTLGQAEETYRLRSDGQRLKVRFERGSKQFNEDLQSDRLRIVNDIRRKVLNLVVRYSHENGYTIIFDSSVQDPLIVYKSTSLDLTDEIIRLYDKSFPADIR